MRLASHWALVLRVLPIRSSFPTQMISIDGVVICVSLTLTEV